MSVVLEAIYAKDGRAVFGSVKLPPEKLTGVGEVETRLVGDYGPLHVSPKGKAYIITVVQGRWTVRLSDGTVKSFGPGRTLVVQDGEAPAESGHQSQSNGDLPLVLQKTILNHTLEVLAT